MCVIASLSMNNQYRKLIHIRGKVILKALYVLGKVDYMAFIASLASMFPVYANDRTSSRYQHFFYLRQILETLQYISGMHVILLGGFSAPATVVPLTHGLKPCRPVSKWTCKVSIVDI